MYNGNNSEKTRTLFLLGREYDYVILISYGCESKARATLMQLRDPVTRREISLTCGAPLGLMEMSHLPTGVSSRVCTQIRFLNGCTGIHG